MADTNLTCIESDCLSAVLAKSLCRAHYRNGLVAQTVCQVEGCSRPWHVRKICLMHYKRFKRNGHYGLQGRNLGVSHLLPDFVRVKHGGYVRLARHNPDGTVDRVLEHRVVFELELGRKLLAHENVHHINGQRDDNRLENLELWSSMQPSGQRVTDKVEWAKAILSLYGE